MASFVYLASATKYNDIKVGIIGASRPTSNQVNDVYRVAIPQAGVLGLASGFAITDVIDSIPREGSSLRGTAQWINDYSYGVTFSLYRDLNGNGILDTSDGLIGVRTPTSNVNGAMLFQLNVDAGSYLIKVTDSNGFGNPFNLNMYSRSAARVVYDAGSTYALSRADRLTGSAANNVYIVDNASDLIAETLNGGIDTVRSSVSYILPANVENLTLTGSAAINATGNALANTLTGNGAANILNGAAGADRLIGGAGNDTYVVDNAADVVVEAANAGTDTVQASVSHTLAANVENLTLTGSAAINGTGNALANTITGNGAANILSGAAGVDRLIGGSGNDRLIGGLGNDSLTGGLGADIFRFDAGLSSTTNRDTITDFNARQGDGIQLENAVFTALTRTGTLAATAFRSGSSFTTAAQRILYNPATGNLSYDSNGNARGGVQALIATLTTKPALTSSIFVVT
jgi:Ca2+-binding RTX toxin-like protein